MKIPLSKYELAHIRKALTAGLSGAVAVVLTAVSNHTDMHSLIVWPGIGGVLAAFFLPLFLTFNIPNKDLVEIEKLADAFDPAVAAAVHVALDPVLAAQEPSDAPVLTDVPQDGPVPLVTPPAPAPGGGGGQVSGTGAGGAGVSAPPPIPEQPGSPE